MSNTSDALVEHVKKLNDSLKEKKTYLTQVHDNIKRLKQEARNVESMLTKIGGAIEAYNDTINLLAKADGVCEAAAVEAEVVEAEIVNEGEAV